MTDSMPDPTTPLTDPSPGQTFTMARYKPWRITHDTWTDDEGVVRPSVTIAELGVDGHLVNAVTLDDTTDLEVVREALQHAGPYLAQPAVETGEAPVEHYHWCARDEHARLVEEGLPDGRPGCVSASRDALPGWEPSGQAAIAWLIAPEAGRGPGRVYVDGESIDLPAGAALAISRVVYESTPEQLRVLGETLEILGRTALVEELTTFGADTDPLVTDQVIRSQAAAAQRGWSSL